MYCSQGWIGIFILIDKIVKYTIFQYHVGHIILQSQLLRLQQVILTPYRIITNNMRL